MAAGPAQPSASVSEQPPGPGLKSLSENPERGEFRRGHGRGRSGNFFVAGKLQGLGWVGIKARRERSGHGGCGVLGAAWGSGTSPGLYAAPQGQEDLVWDKPAEDPNIYPGITSHPEGFTAEPQRDPNPEMFPGLALGSSIRGSLDPNPALPRLPGGVWAPRGCLSTGIKGWRRRAASKLFVGCGKWDFRAAPAHHRPARAAQDSGRAAGGAAPAAAQPRDAICCSQLQKQAWSRPSPALPETNPPNPLKQRKSAPHAPPGAPEPPEPWPRVTSPSPAGRAQPFGDKTQAVASCRIPFPSGSIPGKGRIEAQPGEASGEGGECPPHPLDSARLHRGENPPRARSAQGGHSAAPGMSQGWELGIHPKADT